MRAGLLVPFLRALVGDGAPPVEAWAHVGAMSAPFHEEIICQTTILQEHVACWLDCQLDPNGKRRMLEL